MRTTKRFTPKVLERYERQGRGKGTFQDYSPWHQVTRGDPASHGRSHLLYWRKRLVHLLSDHEWGAQLFGLMLPNVVDSVEQMGLEQEESSHPLSPYSLRCPHGAYPGTVALSEELQIKHPRVHGDGKTKLWKMTSDLMLVLRDGQAHMSILAVAVKPKDWLCNKRTVDLLRLEREYWVRRGIQWLLVTPSVWEMAVVLTLRRSAPWSLDQAADSRLKQLSVDIALANPTASVIRLLERLERYAPSLHEAQRALWQAVWSGDLPIDLRRGWRPQEPIRLLSNEAFLDLNPIASGRSAWI